MKFIISSPNHCFWKKHRSTFNVQYNVHKDPRDEMDQMQVVTIIKRFFSLNIDFLYCRVALARLVYLD